MDANASAQQIFALERPDASLWKLYLIRAVLSGPAIVITLPLFFFRFRTLRYRFDEEGIHMRVGVLFRREVNLTYARIQDIHLQSGMIQRWLGLADIQIQTASGSASAELVIEGFKEYEAIRDFLYTRMRGAKGGGLGAQERLPDARPVPSGAADDETVALLLSIRDELRRTRELLEQRNSGSASSPTNTDV
jgi:putative membrane protein